MKGTTMKLLTKEILDKFKKQGCTDGKNTSEIKIIAKFFSPIGVATWYATEYIVEERIFFGFVSLFNDYNDELGYFSLDELEQFRGKFGLGIERDRFFGDHFLSEVINGSRP